MSRCRSSGGNSFWDNWTWNADKLSVYAVIRNTMKFAARLVVESIPKSSKDLTF